MLGDEKKSGLERRALHYYQALVREAPASGVRADADQFIGELEPGLALAEARERQGQIDAARGTEALPLAQTFLRDGQTADAAATTDRLRRELDKPRDPDRGLRGARARRRTPGRRAGRRGAVQPRAGGAARRRARRGLARGAASTLENDTERPISPHSARPGAYRIPKYSLKIERIAGGQQRSI
ncbi:MAG TPA: hypothetical protein VFH68_18415 [Polyangia bacterium]|nr:hypothetical protein [Polyangia bacterium]